MTHRIAHALVFAAALPLSVLAPAAPARAQQAAVCADHAVIVARLAERWGESRQSIGLAANNTVVEVFASDSGSWTITVTRPGGPTCLVASGEHYQHVAEALPNIDEPA
ncbi:hypothetical protein [Histidinibacterium lentulum]|uniref:PepSY domain-containing protein n=1 Tax=Histidinibacterium lentulum TaxID=2480588 RepID=A0A3N2R1F9_9RHOB|nr:hypothetical protein [Histidinibacterium lentulum]ROU01156.1 hypothetical protein EAT49_11580 [Histidinibacterium lentulum]